MSGTASLLLNNVRLPNGAAADILVVDGIIARVEPGIDAASAGVDTIDGAGDLVLPGLVDGHMHIDKTLFGLPWSAHPAGPDRESRIATEKRLRQNFARSVEERASSLVRNVIGLGTCALRTHVDVDTEIGLANLRAILAVRERYRDLIDIQIVAFPQSGVVRCAGVAALLDQAIGEGADLVGGLDPIAFDGDLDGQLDVLFDIAERRDVGIDFHIHDVGATGMAEITAIAERTQATGLDGRITISHGFCLGACDEAAFDRVTALMAMAGLSLATHGGGASPLPPVKRLRDLGITVFAGNDNIRDTWSPYGEGDMLERAMLTAWRSGFRTDADLEIALDLASYAGAAALGLDGYGLALGCRADFVSVSADTPAQAVIDRPTRSLVLKDGQVVARRGVLKQM